MPDLSDMDAKPRAASGKMGDILAAGFGRIPHADLLGIECVSFQDSEAILKIPFHPKLTIDTDERTIHPGVISTLIDTSFGLAIGCALKQMRMMSTIDMHLAFIKPISEGQDILAWARCESIGQQVAYVRALAYGSKSSKDDPAVEAIGTFFLTPTPMPFK